MFGVCLLLVCMAPQSQGRQPADVEQFHLPADLSLFGAVAGEPHFHGREHVTLITNLGFTSISTLSFMLVMIFAKQYDSCNTNTMSPPALPKY